MSSEVIKLLKEKRCEEALQSASTVVLEDIRHVRLHKDPVIRWTPRLRARYAELMPKEVTYQETYQTLQCFHIPDPNNLGLMIKKKNR
jgi:hypothetical protein